MENAANSLEGMCVWKPLQDDNKLNLNENYYEKIDKLFNNHTFSLEKACYFLYVQGLKEDKQIKLKQIIKQLLPNKETKQQEDEVLECDDFCYICKEGGNILICEYLDSKTCKQVFHPACLKLEKIPEGKFICPYHHCKICNKDVGIDVNTYRCVTCPTTYCVECLPEDLSFEKDIEIAILNFQCINCYNKDYFTILTTLDGKSIPKKTQEILLHDDENKIEKNYKRKN